MLDESEEKAKVAMMQQTMTDILDEVASLKKNTDNTKTIFSGRVSDDYVVEMINHTIKIEEEAENLESEINSYKGIIDNIHQEEVEAINREKRENGQNQNGNNNNDNNENEIDTNSDNDNPDHHEYRRPKIPFNRN